MPQPPAPDASAVPGPADPVPATGPRPRRRRALVAAAAALLAALPAAVTLARGPIALAEQPVSASVTSYTDLAYAGTSDAQRLDLYLPATSGTAPLVIDIHGGGFSEGDKSDEEYNREALLAAGYAVASVNYRLSGEAAYPAAVQDVKASVRWLRANAATYGLDSTRFAVWGRSAGGTLAELVGATGGRTTVFDDASLGNASVSSAVQAVIAWYSPSDLRTEQAQNTAPGGCEGTPLDHDAADSPEGLWLGAQVSSVTSLAAQASPVTWAASATTLPPFSLAHGTADCTVPYGQSQEMATVVRAGGGTAALTLLDGAVHEDDRFATELVDPAVAFLDAAL